MPVSKKIFIASLTILGILLIFLGIWQLNFRGKVDSQKTPALQSDDKGETPLTKTSQANIKAISDKKVSFPFVDFSNSRIQYYSQEAEAISQMNLDGSAVKKLFTEGLTALTDIVWAPNGTKAILKNGQGDTASYRYYNRDEEKAVPIKNIDAIVWQNINKIFYKYYDAKTQERSLNIANPDGSDWLKITDINSKKTLLAPIPKSGFVSTWNGADALAETTLEAIPFVGGEKKTIFTGKFGADYVWNANGDTVLISHSDQKGGTKMQLAIANEQGGEYKNLNIATFVSKCVWSKDNATIFCAVPDNFPATAVLPNDYLEGKIKTKDSFWKINTKTGEKSSLINPTKIPVDMDASNLFINDQDNMLIFLNKLDNKLYKLEL